MDAEKRKPTQILSHRQISSTGYELKLERGDRAVRAGELISLYGAGPLDGRDYTVASGEQDPFLDVLYRLIPEGVLTPQLVPLKAGDMVDISGPYGTFVVRDATVPMVFIATGTGIAPCRAFLRSNPEINLTVLHGCAAEEDLFYREELSGYSYYPCVSGEAVAGFQGRVTDRLRSLSEKEIPANAHFYLCGANEMIYEVQDLLAERGIDPQQIFTEPYYYRAND